MIFFWPNRFEKFSLVCGIEGDPRMFRILRNGVPVLSHKEVGTGSLLGAAYRGVGGGHEGRGRVTVADQPGTWISASARATTRPVTQSGFLQHNNIGDQKMYLRLHRGRALREAADLGRTRRGPR
jgi:hypothetical protein